MYVCMQCMYLSMYLSMYVYVCMYVCIYIDKAILRGHEAAVVDLTFSPVRSDCLCSIDQGDSLSGSHVIGASP